MNIEYSSIYLWNDGFFGLEGIIVQASGYQVPAVVVIDYWLSWYVLPANDGQKRPLGLVV